MSLHAGVGIARGGDGFEAGYAAAIAAKENMGGIDANAAIIFSSVRYSAEEVRAGVRSALPNAMIIGCSEAGIISNSGVTKGSVGVMTLHKKGLTAQGMVVDNLDVDFEQALSEIYEFIDKSDQISCLHLLLMDGLASRNEPALYAIQQLLDAERAPLVGGCASDGLRFTGTYQFGQEQVARNGVALLSLGGSLKAGIGVQHGYFQAGLPKIVTAAEGNVIIQIANEPAVDFYESYFDSAAELIAHEPMAMLSAQYPLGFAGDEEFLVIRDVLRLKKNGELQLAGDIPVGREVSLMVATKQDLLEAAEQAARDAVARLNGAAPRAALIFNCVGRHRVFGSQAYEEIDRVMRIIGNDVPMLGFYTYGEFSPIMVSGCSRLHNKTVVVVLLA